MAYDPFENLHKFQDDVWGQIHLNDLERDIIDTPEFQRLFRTSQLGFVKLVYHTANHTRGAHSIGACHIANRLISRLADNTKELHRKYEKDCPGLYASFEISPAERILIRLGALLHDISHVPLSHDLEKKSHLIFYNDTEPPLKLRSWYGHYDKHDDYERNPLLYLLVCDHRSSVLGRVLRSYSEPFWAQLQLSADAEDESRHSHIKRFVAAVRKKKDPDWSPNKDLLPQLLFHLLFYEKLEEAGDPARTIATSFDDEKKTEHWHLGPKSLTETEIREWHDSWYQPFRHDIIGNTLSADLIDYLTRDPQRLGTQRRVDLHLLSYYVLVNQNPNASPKRYRCAIDLTDRKRGTTRTFLLNDLFRLLDLRQDIHEKAVMHRVVQSANAMLARGLLLLNKDALSKEDRDRRPRLKEVVGLGEKQCHALQSEDTFFEQLLRICDKREDISPKVRRRLDAARRIFQKLVERRVCRPLVIIPGDWAAKKLLLPRSQGRNVKSEDFPLRTLAAIVDSAYYSPFLLFVCSSVEKYLEGIFDTDAELCNNAHRIIADDSRANRNLVDKASNLISNRVIIWTAPYKQLYKDPAVVVALDGYVDQIDKVVTASGVTISDESTRARIETAIRDADSKYATLWQLYVFISDGLYYSGILNKLIAHLPDACKEGQERDGHKERLKNAQALLTVAFEAVCSNWSGLNDKQKTVLARQEVLSERMDVDAFRQLVGRWIGVYRDKKGRVEKLFTVNIEQYYHEYSLDERVKGELKRPCRDSRYKFDRNSQEVWKAAVEAPTSDEYALVEFLKQCYIDDPKLLSEGEFEEMVELYKDEGTRKRCATELGKAATNQRWVTRALKQLLLAEFPWSEEELGDVPSVESAFPTTEPEIEDWLRREIRNSDLNRNVIRSLQKDDLKPLVGVLRRTSSIYGRAVFDDFRVRLENDVALQWNAVTLDGIVNALREKWSDRDVETSPRGPDED